MRIALFVVLFAVGGLVSTLSSPTSAAAEQECLTVAYVGNHPRGKDDLGWNEAAQGITHDADHWFITQSLRLWKIPATHDLDEKASCDDFPCTELGDTALADYNHLGDLDHYRGYLCIAVSGEKRPPVLAFFGAEDLLLKDSLRVSNSESESCLDDGTGCVGSTDFCAIDSAGFVYTNDDPRNGNRLQKWMLNWDDFAQGAAVRIVDRFVVDVFDEAGVQLDLFAPQGAAFSDDDRLYFINGNATEDCEGAYPGGCGIHVLEMTREEAGAILPCSSGAGDCRADRLELSHNGYSTKTPFNFEYEPGFWDYQEPEGITWWDLTAPGAPQVPGSTTAGVEVASSQLHAIMLENDLGADDVWLKHYQRCDLPSGIVATPSILDVEVGVGGQSFNQIELSNRSDVDLRVEDVRIRPGGSPAFALASVPELPATISPQSFEVVEVSFTPSSDTVVTAVLEIVSDDPGDPLLEIALVGRGLSFVDQARGLLELFDQGVEEALLAGVGAGESAENRREALRQMLGEALILLEGEFVNEACGQLHAALMHSDGEPAPGDFVSGPAAVTLADEIRTLRDHLDCKIPRPAGCGIGFELVMPVAGLMGLRRWARQQLRRRTPRADT